METTKFTESILQTLSIMAKNAPVEIRMLHVDRRGTVSGYYEDYNRLVKDIQQFDGKNDIYITMNEISTDIVARSKNHLTKYAKHTTRDEEIVSRRWLLVDLDPSRAAGISSTDTELEAAEIMSSEIKEYLCSVGFPEPIYAISGNGYHLLYSLDEVNSESVTKLIQQFLKALDGKFSNEKVKVDTSTYNAARIVKLYGTTACKGDHTDDRPHRRSYIISAPEDITPVTIEQLRSVITACNGVSEEEAAKEPVKVKNIENRKPKCKFTRFEVKDFCETHGIVISHEKPYANGGTCYVLDSCPWNQDHTDKSAYIVQFPNGKIMAGCHHDSCAEESWGTLLKKFPDVKKGIEPSNSNPLENTEGMSMAQILLEEIKQAGHQFYHDKGENAYVSVMLDNGHREYMSVQDKRYCRSLRRKFYQNYHKALSRESLQQVLDTLEAEAVYSGEEIEPAIRCKYVAGKIYYHLADEEQTVICIDETGIHVMEESPIPFIKKQNMLEQVMPTDIKVAKGKKKPSFRSIAKKYWKFTSEDDLMLHNIILLTRFISDIPAPFLYYKGDRGSAKTTSMKLDGKLIDPSYTDVKAFPNAINDVVAAFSGQYLVAFDNLEGSISPEISNLLCVSCSAGYYSKRKLYTDNDTADIQLKARISLSGITTITERADFLDRCITLSSQRILDSERKTVDDILTDFSRDLPYLLFRAMKILSKAIPVYQSLELTELPRMADFAKWGYAIAEVMNYGGERFLEAYKRNQEVLLEVMIEEDDLLNVVRAFVREHKHFWGSMTDLYSQLTQQAQKMGINIKVGWVKTVNALSRKLSQSQSVLEPFGIYIRRGKSNGNRYVEIWSEEQTEKNGGHNNE